MSFTVLPGFEQLTQERYARLEQVNRWLGDFVRAYDAYVLALESASVNGYAEAEAELNRQYELLDALGEDRP